MKTNYGELVDKYTILKIKKDLLIGNVVDEELREVKAKLESAGLINTGWESRLSSINQLMWEIEDKITDETELEKIGIFCLALRHLNKMRVEEKNEISKAYGGYKEMKEY